MSLHEASTSSAIASQWCRLAAGLVFLSTLASFAAAQTSDGRSDWIQYPPKLSPRTPVSGSIDGKSTWLQYPPPKSAELGIKSPPTYKEDTQTVIVRYTDGTSNELTQKAVSQEVSWADDHITKKITYKFADGTSNSEVTTVLGKERVPIYSQNKKIITIDYGDGSTSIVTTLAEVQRTAWTDDKRVKISTYTFPDGYIHQEMVKVKSVNPQSLYEKNVQTIFYSYEDGSNEKVTVKAVNVVVKWSNDHVTKKSTATFPDGSKNTWVEQVNPVLTEPKYEGDIQVITMTYGDGFIKSQRNKAIRETVKWDEDRVTKTTTYFFADKTENSVVSRQEPSVGKPTYDGVVQSKVVKYADGSESVVQSQPVTSRVEWLADHITRKTHHSYADGAINTVTEKIKGTAGKPSYQAEVQRVEVVYGDGFVEVQESTAIDTKVSWAADHITKTSVYRFKDGTSSEEIESVPPIVSSPIYKNGEQTVKTTYGNGTESTVVHPAIKQEDNWSKAKTQRQMTYVFADGSKHVELFILNSEGQLININEATKSNASKKSITFPVQKFEFEGNTKFTNAQLSDLLSYWLRHEIDFEVLKNAAAVISNKYRESGFLAKTEIPQQDVTSGIVKLNIVESKLSAVISVNPLNKTPVNELALGIVDSAHEQGEIVDLDKLNKAAMILSEIPGVQTDLTLRSGDRSGETLAVVQVNPVKPVDGSLTLDNAGSRSTGYERVISQINVSGAVDRGEQLGVQMLKSQGVDFIKFAYSEPIGFNGMRLGINASEMKYQVIASDMLALNAHGPASTRGLDLNAPIVRTQDTSLSLQITLDDKKFRNETFSGLQSKYTGQMLGINMHGSSYDNYGGGGLNTLGLLLVSGDLNLDGSPNQQADWDTTQTAGNFNKLKMSLGRHQKLDPSTAFVLNFQTQLASKNLDGSEKLYLGGSQGVRAYAANEAGGSVGQILSMELQRQIATDFGQMSMAVFTDIGHITVNKFNNYSSALPLNDYTLRGAGLWFGSSSTNRLGGTNYRLTWSRRLGLNPAASVLGLDQDGTYIRNRFWLSANQYF